MAQLHLGWGVLFLSSLLIAEIALEQSHLFILRQMRGRNNQSDSEATPSPRARRFAPHAQRI